MRDSRSVSTRLKPFPAWAALFLAASGLFVTALTLLMLRDSSISATSSVRLSAPSAKTEATSALGPRHKLDYQQWVTLLGREAEVVAQQKPKDLSVLVGDSLSLWFPGELLPATRTWLNQGISGETSAGLLQRLEVFDKTQPKVIFLMIGINDLIRGVNDETILANQREIVRYLQLAHPKAKIVVQSILPHSADRLTWEGRDRLLKIPNRRIRELNRRLAIIADEENVKYLDLYPLFADAQGNMLSELSSDGLHLSRGGYLVWRSAIEVFQQLEGE